MRVVRYLYRKHRVCDADHAMLNKYADTRDIQEERSSLYRSSRHPINRIWQPAIPNLSNRDYNMHEVEIVNRQSLLDIDQEILMSTVKCILTTEGIKRSHINIAIVDNPTIQQLNARYLQHNNATDVLSFLLERDVDTIEGEIMISAEMAVEMAKDYDWCPTAELLLYLVHGTLHLVGFDDRTDEDRRIMRAQERRYLNALGLKPNYEEGAAL